MAQHHVPHGVIIGHPGYIGQNPPYHGAHQGGQQHPPHYGAQLGGQPQHGGIAQNAPPGHGAQQPGAAQHNLAPPPPAPGAAPAGAQGATLDQIRGLLAPFAQKLDDLQGQVATIQKKRPEHLLDPAAVKWKKEGTKAQYTNWSEAWDHLDRARDAANAGDQNAVKESLRQDVFKLGVFTTLEQNCRSMELRRLAERVPDTLLRAQAESTKCKYFKSWMYFKKWQLRHFNYNSFPVPLFQVVLFMQFIIDTSKHKSRYYKFLYGIRWAHRKSNFASPTDEVIIVEMTQAAKRLLGCPTNKKKPVRSSLIDDIYLKNIQNIQSDPVSRRNCILPNLTHKGFLRISELLKIQRRHIQIKHDSLEIFVPDRKNDQYSEGHTFVVCKSDSISCPYKAVLDLLKDIPEDENSFLIFKLKPKKIVTSNGISTSYARSLFKQVLATVLPESEVRQMSTHSGKRGGIQDADQAGASGVDIDCQAGFKDTKSKLQYMDKKKHSKEVAKRLANL